MPFVIDASVTVAWLMPDEANDVARMAFDRLLDEVAVAPTLWWYEVRNVLLMNERRGRITSQDLVELLAALAQLPIVLDQAPDEAALLSLASTFRLTVYDAAYIELAQRQNVPLASLDRQVLIAARSSGVACIGDA